MRPDDMDDILRFLSLPTPDFAAVLVHNLTRVPPKRRLKKYATDAEFAASCGIAWSPEARPDENGRPQSRRRRVRGPA